MKPSQATKLRNIMTHQTFRDRILHWAYEFEIWAKGFDAILEIIGGFILLLTTKLMLNQWVIAITQHELVEDPRDVVATFLRQSVANLPVNMNIFGGLYLVVHGTAKLWLVGGLLAKKAWAYPLAIIFLGLFIFYQLYRMSYQFSIGLLVLTVFDAAFVLLILREYRLSKHR